jgi:aspartyl-tRNA(Asn)/glutamyl-tRNA(Gln) amidotransferase subunit C
MSITPTEVREVARLARLDLTVAEVERLTSDLSHILTYVEKLGELDTAGIEPTPHAVPLECPRRSDAIESSLDQATTLAAAPASQDGFFSVPAILDAPETAR